MTRTGSSRSHSLAPLKNTEIGKWEDLARVPTAELALAANKTELISSVPAFKTCPCGGFMSHETHFWCQLCCGDTDHVSVTRAAQIAGVTNRTIYLWATRGTVHVNRTAGGPLWICQPSLHPVTKDVIKPTSKASIDGRIQLVIKLVEQQYERDDPTLSKMAKHARLSIWYLARLFKRNTGSHFSEYLRNVRLKKAERLLQDPTLSIKEIAAAVGYKYVSDFNHHFKSAYGMGPGEYRRSQQTQRRQDLYSQ